MFGQSTLIPGSALFTLVIKGAFISRNVPVAPVPVINSELRLEVASKV